MSSTGKWAEAGVPHKGWEWLGLIDDLEEPSFVCEMCEVKIIRYVHHMVHPDYPDELEVGCVCAENMSQDYVNPAKRERALINRAKREQKRREREAKAREQEAERIRQIADIREREKERLRMLAAAREQRWLDTPFWRTNDKGNLTLDGDYYFVVIFCRPTGAWGGVIENKITGDKQWCRPWRTAEKAKREAYELLGHPDAPRRPTYRWEA
jgi:hypothetical protein